MKMDGPQPVTWLGRIEALKPGDACEIRYGGNWVPGTVLENGGPYLWRVEIADKRTSLYIEQVRCPGQTEAWPR